MPVRRAASAAWRAGARGGPGIGRAGRGGARIRLRAHGPPAPAWRGTRHRPRSFDRPGPPAPDPRADERAGGCGGGDGAAARAAPAPRSGVWRGRRGEPPRSGRVSIAALGLRSPGGAPCRGGRDLCDRSVAFAAGAGGRRRPRGRPDVDLRNARSPARGGARRRSRRAAAGAGLDLSRPLLSRRTRPRGASEPVPCPRAGGHRPRRRRSRDSTRGAERGRARFGLP